MLPQPYRLPLQKDIPFLGKKTWGKYCGVVIRQSNVDHMQAAVIVSKKVSKKAVDRNKLKRQYRALLWENKDLLAGNQVLVIVKKEALHQEFENLESDMLQLINRIS